MHKPRRTPATSAPAQRRYEAGPAPVTSHVPASRGRLIRTPLSPIGRTRLLSDLAVEHPRSDRPRRGQPGRARGGAGNRQSPPRHDHDLNTARYRGSHPRGSGGSAQRGHRVWSGYLYPTCRGLHAAITAYPAHHKPQAGKASGVEVRKGAAVHCRGVPRLSKAQDRSQRAEPRTCHDSNG